METNEGLIDRLIRAVVGIALIVWALTGGPVWAWIGVVPLLTAAVGWCPLYAVLGLRTCPAARQH
jgi:hypothetical protein